MFTVFWRVKQLIIMFVSVSTVNIKKIVWRQIWSTVEYEDTRRVPNSMNTNAENRTVSSQTWSTKQNEDILEYRII